MSDSDDEFLEWESQAYAKVDNGPCATGLKTFLTRSMRISRAKLGTQTARQQSLIRAGIDTFWIYAAIESARRTCTFVSSLSNLMGL